MTEDDIEAIEKEMLEELKILGLDMPGI